MRSNDQYVLGQLVQCLNEGTEQYHQAVEISECPDNRAKFRCMAKSRTAAVAYLQPYLNIGNTTEPTHAFGSVLHKIYPEILSGLNRRFDTQLISQLESIEQQTLQQMQCALEAVASPLLKSVILDLHPKLPCTNAPGLTYEQAC